MKKYIPHLIVAVLFLSFSIVIVHAQTPGGSGSGGASGPVPPVTINTGIANPFGPNGPTNLKDLFTLLINNLLIPIGGVAAVLAFIYSGFLYVMAQGNETKITKANQSLLYTAIGTAILLGAWVISNVISSTINQLK